MRIQVAVYTVGHLLVHCGRMRFTVAVPARGNARMIGAVAEGTGERLVLGHGFFQGGAGFFMTCDAEAARSGHSREDLQRMVGRVAAQAVAEYLTLGVRFMALGALWNLTVNIMAEGTGLLGMFALVVGEILSRTLMAGQTGILDIGGQMQGKGLMGIGVAGKAVLKFEMGPSLVTF